MATQLFLLSTVPDTHLGTNNVNLRSTAGGWASLALGTARGSGVATTSNTTTVTGPTPGVDSIQGTETREWISPPVSADVTISGTITANIWASESNMNDNVAINVVVEIIRANALGLPTPTRLSRSSRSTRVTEIAVTTEASTTSPRA